MTRETFLKSWKDGLKQNIMRLTLKSSKEPLTEKEQKELNAYLAQLDRMNKGEI